MEAMKLNDTEIDVVIIEEATEAVKKNQNAGCYVGDLLRIIHRLQSENGKQKAEIERLTEEKGNASLYALQLFQENIVLKKQVDELKEERENMLNEIFNLEQEKEDLYFQNKNLQSYIDYHEPIWKRNTEQAVKDSAKEIYKMADEIATGSQNDGVNILIAIKERYGVEVE